MNETMFASSIGDDRETMGMVLDLQALQVPEEDYSYGNSCTSTLGSNCCNC